MYLCDYFCDNAMPVMQSLCEGPKLHEEKKIVNLLRDMVRDGEIQHSDLLTASRMSAKEFNTCISSLVEKQAVIAMDRGIGYNNRTEGFYRLNPVLV
jgi:hypothetical protein